MIMKWPVKRENFQGRQIPAGVGIVLPLALIISYVAVLGYIGITAHENPILILINPEQTDSRIALCWLVLVVAAAALGFLDDRFGRRGAGGFKGHFGALMRGKVTTGLAKAVGGGFAAMFAAYWLRPELSPTLFIIDTLVIALAMNTFNLLDMRPGRALKAFFAVMAGLLFAYNSAFWFLPAVVPILICAAVLFVFDLRAKAMLGDAGSNVLGAVAGLGFAVALGFWPKLIVLLVLIILNAVSEKWSFTDIIEKLPPLRWLDELGRPAR